MWRILWRMKMQRMEKSSRTIKHTNRTPRQEVKSYLLWIRGENREIRDCHCPKRELRFKHPNIPQFSRLCHSM
jgi:hypothetical protein